MSNTRETLGEQATLDGLIAHTLTTLEEDGVTSLGQYALYKNTGLTSVKFPSLTTINSSAFQDCSNLTTVDIGAKCTINAAFSGCSKMDALILRNASAVSTLNSSSALSGTKIATGFGGVYVPNTLLSNYKSASNWSTMASNIYPIDDYPRTSFDTISDSWATIIANCAAGTTDDYNIGDTKQLTINGVDFFVEIVAKNTDILASDETKTAALTWLCKDIPFKHRMNPSNNANGWVASEMRSWLRSDILTALPSDLQSGIKEVKKTWYDYTTTSTLSSSDTIWIPSTYEMFSDTSNSVVEGSGVQYTKFNNNANRIKKYNGSNDYYWLRSANTSGSDYFYNVSTSGIRGNYGANYSNGVAFGFCT